jgi:cyclophilin family peptidyl-prolyl cis-trans isomerase
MRPVTPPTPSARIWRTRLVRALLLAVAALPGAWAGADETRAPVPDTGARANAVSELRKELRDKLESKDPEIRRTLARTLIERAKTSETDPVKRYVLLDQALSLGEGVRDVRLALDAVDELSLSFQQERAPRGLAAVDAITRSAKETGVLAEAAGACVELAGAALAADDPSSAAKALATAKTLSKAAKLGGLAARVTELSALVDAFRRSSAAAAIARKTLATTPDDPAANEAVGRFLAFGRGRWEEGLPLLAKAPDTPLSGLAKSDGEAGTDAGARQTLADGWWDWAQKEKDPLAKARALAHAATLYEQAPADAPAERAALVKSRLDAITYRAFDRGIALTKDFSKDGPVSLALATVRAYIAQQKIEHVGNGWRTRLPRFPDITFGKGEEYLWRLDTNQGVITLRFFADTAPKHVANFLYLSELGFFDGLGFHRVVPGFMAQGGCPNGNGSGNPGYGFAGEFGASHKHDKPGILSMANTGTPDSDGSQFFITFRATAELDGKHTVFGEVVDGMDVVKKLEALGTPEPGKPKSPLVINSARVVVR